MKWEKKKGLVHILNCLKNLKMRINSIGVLLGLCFGVSSCEAQTKSLSDIDLSESVISYLRTCDSSAMAKLFYDQKKRENSFRTFKLDCKLVGDAESRFGMPTKNKYIQSNTENGGRSVIVPIVAIADSTLDVEYLNVVVLFYPERFGIQNKVFDYYLDYKRLVQPSRKLIIAPPLPKE